MLMDIKIATPGGNAYNKVIFFGKIYYIKNNN